MVYTVVNRISEKTKRDSTRTQLVLINFKKRNLHEHLDVTASKKKAKPIIPMKKFGEIELLNNLQEIPFQG